MGELKVVPTFAYECIFQTLLLTDGLVRVLSLFGGLWFLPFMGGCGGVRLHVGGGRCLEVSIKPPQSLNIGSEILRE